MSKNQTGFLAAAFLLACALLAVAFSYVPGFAPFLCADRATAEGPLQTVHITAGPFDIHRRYRSMEGPYVRESFRIADLIESKQVVIPESHIHFVERSDPVSMDASISTPAKDRGRINKTLYWLKGVKLQVLDENDKPLPTAEFICHMNLDVEPREHVFEKVEGGNPRLLTLTQGQTDFQFPAGFAVPLSSEEKWKFTMQAANRTTDAHRRIKHLLTLEFIKDSDLRQPVKALAWYTPYIAVVVDKKNADQAEHHGLDCGITSSAAPAPNMVAGAEQKDALKRVLTGHWAVPPGVHTYKAPVTDERDRGIFSKDRIVHAVWTHIHPTCVKTSLVLCDGATKRQLYCINSQTKFDHGLELAHIDNFSAQAGLLLPAHKHYEIEAVYDNKTATAQDAMVAQGIYFEDQEWVKPDWRTATAQTSTAAAEGTAAESIATSPANAATSPGKAATSPEKERLPADYGGSDEYPLFQVKTDGPLLTAKKIMTLTTSAGPMHLELDPALAPQNATQVYKLLQAGAFDGTTMFRYEPGFLLEVAPVDVKHDRHAPLSNQAAHKLRRLPLEVSGQEDGVTWHKKWSLTMSHYNAPDSAVSSFGILLADAPHLDHQFTVFGSLLPDKVTLSTLDKIVAHWSGKSPPYIVQVREDVSAAVAVQPEHVCNDLYCGIKTPVQAKPASEAELDHGLYPVFSVATDGPLLSASKNMIMKTSAGNLHLCLEPALAPKNASQMYRLFRAGAFDGTPLVRCEPNFVLQTALAETKTGTNQISSQLRALLRRLPLETAAQTSVQGQHKRFALSMAHADDPDSAVSSFSILLAAAPHLDQKYTVFGHLLSDRETIATLQKIIQHFKQSQPTILKVEESPHNSTRIAATR